MKKSTLSIIIFLLCVLPVAVVADNLRITYLDVGQGDAALLQCGGQTMLVDTGSEISEEALLAFLDKAGVVALDYLVGTHPHEDHIGNMDAVLAKYDVQNVWMPRVKNEIKAFDDALLAIKQSNLMINAPVVDTEFTLGDAIVTILAPMSEAYENLDDYSIVFRVDHGRNSFLFTGDAGRVSEDEMLASRSDIDVNVLKVSNHGGNTSSTKAFLAATTPDIAIISCGLGNENKDPQESTLQALQEAGALILRTDENGTIQIDSDRTTLFYDQELALGQEDGWYGRINTKNVNVRKGASKRTDRIAYFDEGAAVKVLLTVENDTGDTWYLVEMNGVRGYVLSDFVEPVNPLSHNASDGETEEYVDDELDEYFMPTAVPGGSATDIVFATPTGTPNATLSASATASLPPPTIPVPQTGDNEETAPAVQYIGSVISKIFHKTTCDNLPAQKNQVTFASRALAVSGGYIPCLSCNP